MPYKGPHISIKSESLVNRILHINFDEFEEWPEGVRRLAIEIAEELFMVRYNPFINPDTVRESVNKTFERARRGLSMHYANTISEGITMFWSAHDSDRAFRREIIDRLSEVISKDSIDVRSASRVENATDATDLRLELPLLVVTPASAEEVSAVVRVANEMHFAIIPRGGGSGFTGGAIPARKRSVIVSLTKLTAIKEVNTENMTMTAEAGVITIDAIRAAAAKGALFSVDPASKTASSIGGNVAENSGGPLAVEYGTTIDNILSYRMVLPTGEIIEVTRKDHPRRKIEENDEAVFEVRDISGGLRNVVKITGAELRKPGLGKDVTNKALGGLPGVQKEGVDGIITEATFVLHPKLKHHRVIVVEFYGASMHNAALAINDIIALRDKFRSEGDLVKLTMLEEFNSKYVQAIDYRKKSTCYEGHPISVLTIQVDSDDETALDKGAADVVAACAPYDGVDSFVAKDDKEGELFWEDRHKLSAIAKRTSGFKINEDIVIPLAALPEFSLYLEELNVEYMARAYRRALQAIGRMRGVAEDDKEFNREFTYASKIIKGEYPKGDPHDPCAERLSDQGLQLHAVLYLNKLKGQYPELEAKITKVEEHMLKSQIVVASHMHAGDGNCHVNLPVNSGDVDMMAEGYEVADKVMAKAKALGGAVTGEHGIGITKIAFQDEERIAELREYKQLMDPRNIVNPAKLTQRELPVSSFTFSFNKLIEDLDQSGLPDKERLIDLLKKVQICTRCGKCKEVCAMHYPEKDMLFYPRNRNMSLGALIEAIYYSQVNSGKVEPALMRELADMMEHCTVCGKCTAVCPVKINSEEVTLTLRSFLESEGFGGHPFKERVINYLADDPAARLPKAAKLASVGQKTANRFLPMVPQGIRDRFYNPIFNSPGPVVGYLNLFEGLKLEKGSIFVPQGEVKGTVFYFPGCGSSLFYRGIGMAAVALLLSAGYAVALPPELLCCGFPALAAGLQEAFAVNQNNNITKLRELAEKAARLGYPVSRVLTSCGSCRDGLERHFITQVMQKANEDAGCPLDAEIGQEDVFQFLARVAPSTNGHKGKLAEVIYHAPCHAEWSGVAKQKAASAYAKALENSAGVKPVTSPGCCAESGTGGMTSPLVYNKLRERKKAGLENVFPLAESDAPVLVGCPSCRMGITRSLMGMKEKRRVLHTLEFLAEQRFGKDWRGRVRKLLGGAPAGKDGLRMVDMSSLAAVDVLAGESESDD